MIFLVLDDKDTTTIEIWFQCVTLSAVHSTYTVAFKHWSESTSREPRKHFISIRL